MQFKLWAFWTVSGALANQLMLKASRVKGAS